MAKYVNTAFGNFLLPADVARDLVNEKMMAMSGGYTGASLSRRSLSEWNPATTDADSAMSWDLQKLRNRSSDLIRNNPLAAGAISTKVSYVIGTGLKLKASVKREFLGLTDEQADAWESTAEFEFLTLAKMLDVSSGTDFSGIQDIAFRSRLEKGDVFALITSKNRKNNPYSLAIQMIEAERVTNEKNKRNTQFLVNGVEKNADGSVKNYHVLMVHPGANTSRNNRKWRKVPAFDGDGRPVMLHLCKKSRPGQTRDVPDLSKVIEPLKQLGRYTDSELMAAVIGGMYSVFIKTENDEMPEVLPGNESLNDDNYKLGNGAIVGLGVNESIEIANPGRPNQAFDPFVLAILRQIGVALELPYEILIKHYTSSYSASRAALLEAWRYFMRERHWLTEQFCQPIYEAFIDEAVALGRLSAPGYFADPFIRAAYLGTEWVGSSMPQIDELKGANADEKYINIGVKTIDQVTKQRTGGDWDRNHRQQVKEINRRKVDGIHNQTGTEAGFFMPPENNNVNDNDD